MEEKTMRLYIKVRATNIAVYAISYELGKIKGK